MRRGIFFLLPALAFLFPLHAAERKPVEFGVCFHHGAYGSEYTPEAEAVLDDLRAAGPFWVRSDFQEHEKDVRFAEDMARKGINVLALLPWYSKDTSGWAAYVERQVRTTPGVPAWEIANEPEMTWWGGPIAAADYMRMLREAVPIIRAKNAGARIVAPAVGANAEGAAYLKQLIDQGLLELVDAVSVHYYPFHHTTELDGIKRLVAGRKPLWITETGWTTADQEGGEAAQRAYVRDHYDPERGTLGADPDVAAIFHYQLNDEKYPALPNEDSGWGLTYGPQGGFGKKAAYEDFRKLIGGDAR